MKKIFPVIFFGCLFFDQGIKFLIRQNGGFYVCNQNIAFSLPIEGIFFYILWLVTMFLAGYFYFYLKKSENTLSAEYLFKIKRSFFVDFGGVLMFSGAIGNILDRFSYGCVVDYIDLKIWPIFNLADIWIFLGALAWIAVLFMRNNMLK